VAERIINVRQPAYLPGVVYFDQLLQSEEGIHVIYDNVQYERRHWGNRNKIINPNGPDGWQWLTVPVITKGKRDQLYSETEIDNSQPWGKHHWKAISQIYSKSPYFDQYAGFFDHLYQRKWDRITDLNVAIVGFLNEQLGIKTKTVLASELGTGADFEDKNMRLIAITKELKGTAYVTVKGTKGYIQPKKFEEAGITLLWHQFEHPTYSQFQGEFIPWMSTIDLLMNCGPESGGIIRANMQKPTAQDY